MGVLDSVLAIVAPGIALKRARFTAQLNAMRKYEGASTSYRNKHWGAASTDATTEIADSLSLLRDRSRQLVRDYSYAARAVSLWTDQTVGAGIVPRPSFGDDVALDKTVTGEWAKFADDCGVDGNATFYAIQHLVMRTVVESGSAFVVYVPSEDGRFRLRVLEPDYLDLQKDSLPGVAPTSNYVVKGIEFDPDHNIVAYWLFDEHPGASHLRALSVFSRRVDAEYVLQVFRRDRPGQYHGVPWLAPVVIRLRNLDEAVDASLVALKMSACLAGYVTGMESGPLTASTADSSGKRIESLRPGALVYLDAGQNIQFSDPPSFGQNSTFLKDMLREVASGMDLPYELLTGDYSQSSFSASRMAMSPFKRRVEAVRSHVLLPMLCVPVWRWFMRSLVLRGVLPYNVEPQSVVWTPPKWESIDPKSEAEACERNVRNGFQSWPEVVSSYGGDPDARILEIKNFNDALDKNGVKVDCDGRAPAGWKGDVLATTEDTASPAPKK